MSIYDLITRLMYIPKTEDGMPRYTTVRVWLKFRTAIDRSWQCPIAFILFVGKKNSQALKNRRLSTRLSNQAGTARNPSVFFYILYYLFIPLVLVFITGSPERTQRPTRGGLSVEQLPLVCWLVLFFFFLLLLYASRRRFFSVSLRLTCPKSLARRKDGRVLTDAQKKTSQFSSREARL